jgi:hypothetical protein
MLGDVSFAMTLNVVVDGMSSTPFPTRAKQNKIKKQLGLNTDHSIPKGTRTFT